MIPLACTLLILVVVGMHFEALELATRLARRLSGLRRYRVAFGILVALAAHLAEVVVFALGWAALLELGLEISVPEPTFADLVYFSGSTYTSLGFGDIVALDSGRIFAVVEGVTGLVLIAWTASFTFYEMNENW